MVKYLMDRVEEIVGLVVMVIGIAGMYLVWNKEIATLFLIASVLGLILAKGGRTERMLKELKELTSQKSDDNLSNILKELKEPIEKQGEKS